MSRNVNTWPYTGDGGMTQNLINGVNAWTECNEDAYYDQLGSVPPIRQEFGAFMVGECYTFRESDGARMFAAFVEIDGRYFGQVKALKEWNLLAFQQEIKSQFGI